VGRNSVGFADLIFDSQYISGVPHFSYFGIGLGAQQE